MSKYFTRDFLVILLLGFSAGLPLAMTSSTLGYWLEESSISLKSIGAIALIGIFYNIKFLWSPLVDIVNIPVLGKLLGRRRSWLICTQACLILAILGLASTHPETALGATVLFALAVAFFSATQDIIIDAFRIETFADNEQPLSVALYTYGYRIGMLISGGLAIKISEFISWNGVYVFLAASIGLGILATLIAREPEYKRTAKVNTLAGQIKHAVIDPFTDFMTRKGWVILLIFVVVYKFPAAFLGGGIMSSFYLKMGFTKDEIFVAVKVFGMAATIFGLALGGIVAARWGLIKALWIDAILQASTNLLFIPIIYTNQNIVLLSTAVAAENIASAMGTVVLIGFISKLCNKEFSATQYALLSSLAAFARTALAANSGWIVASTGWAEFYIITFLSGIPALIMIPFVRKYIDSAPTKP